MEEDWEKSKRDILDRFGSLNLSASTSSSFSTLSSSSSSSTFSSQFSVNRNQVRIISSLFLLFTQLLLSSPIFLFLLRFADFYHIVALSSQTKSRLATSVSRYARVVQALNEKRRDNQPFAVATAFRAAQKDIDYNVHVSAFL
jgi:hypothetical protein